MSCWTVDDVCVLGTGLKECILSGLLSVDGKKGMSALSSGMHAWLDADAIERRRRCHTGGRGAGKKKLNALVGVYLLLISFRVLLHAMVCMRVFI